VSLLTAESLLSALAGSFVPILFTSLVTAFAARAVRVTPCGLAEDADEYWDGDQRDHDQED
jgi:hypothetical protein